MCTAAAAAAAWRTVEEADWEEAEEADSTTSGGEESELESAAGDVSLGEFAALVYRRVHVAARGGAWRRVASCVRAAIASGCGQAAGRRREEALAQDGKRTASGRAAEWFVAVRA